MNTTVDMSVVGRRMQCLRKKSGMTQEEVAELLHVSRNTISRLECGISTWQISTLMEYLHVLNQDALALYTILRPHDAQILFHDMLQYSCQEDRFRSLLRLSIMLGGIY